MWWIALFGIVLTSVFFNFQLLYFEQDANGGYGLALQVLCINISDTLVSQFLALVLIILFIYCFICIFWKINVEWWVVRIEVLVKLY